MYQHQDPGKAWENIFAQGSSSPSGRQEETDYRVTVTRLIHFRFPETLISTSTTCVVLLSTSFTSLAVRLPREDCFLRLENDIRICLEFVFGLVPVALGVG